MTKVDIISGFLGAGKTTFIKELISKVYKESKIVLIENEFGEIGIDGKFMQDSGIEVTEMNSGCICCTLVGDFARALKQVVEQYDPDRIIIEPSGVGKLSDVAKAVSDMSDKAGIKIENLITVVDGSKAEMYMKNFGEFFNNQIEYADTVVLSRTQKMDEKKLAKCVEKLRKKNDKAAIVTTPWNDLSGDMIKEALSNGHDLKEEIMKLVEEMEIHDDHHHDYGHHGDHDYEHHQSHDHHHDHDHNHHHANEHEHHEHDHHHHHDHEGHHHADEVFTSWGIETVRRFSENELKDILKLLETGNDFGEVLRAKGMVQQEDGKWIEFDMVPGETETRDRRADYIGRVCVIGVDLDKEALQKVFG